MTLYTVFADSRTITTHAVRTAVGWAISGKCPLDNKVYDNKGHLLWQEGRESVSAMDDFFAAVAIAKDRYHNFNKKEVSP